MKRITTIPVKDLDSCYLDSKGNRLKVSAFNNIGQKGNFLAPDFIEILLRVRDKVEAKGGNLYIVDLFRSWKTQAEAREAYKSGKKPFVARPGHSFHNSGRAVDISLKDLKFANVAKKDWLKVFWEIAKPEGLLPIIKAPSMNASEAWHFDAPGTDWSPAYEKLSYDEVAKCCVLDIGEWHHPDDSEEKVLAMFIQAQLIRLGNFEIGKVDGIIGKKSLAALIEYEITGLELSVIAEILKGL